MRLVAPLLAAACACSSPSVVTGRLEGSVAGSVFDASFSAESDEGLVNPALRDTPDPSTYPTRIHLPDTSYSAKKRPENEAIARFWLTFEGLPPTVLWAGDWSGAQAGLELSDTLVLGDAAHRSPVAVRYTGARWMGERDELVRVQGSISGTLHAQNSEARFAATTFDLHVGCVDRKNRHYRLCGEAPDDAQLSSIRLDSLAFQRDDCPAEVKARLLGQGAAVRDADEDTLRLGDAPEQFACVETSEERQVCGVQLSGVEAGGCRYELVGLADPQLHQLVIAGFGDAECPAGRRFCVTWR